jgi:uncharacterized membrane protein
MVKVLTVFLLSMVPLLELRGAIIAGFAAGLPWYVSYIVSVIGNIIPVPIILLFVRKAFDFMKARGGKLERMALWFENKGASKSDKVTKYATFGLFLFVAIPLPGTGAWMGSLIAALMNMRLKHSIISVFLGILTAGLIMSLACYGIIGGLDFLFD